MWLLPWSGVVFAAQLEFVDGKCKNAPVPNYISQTNLYDFQGEFPTAEEIQQANEKAVRNLVLPKCAGKSEKFCLALQGYTSVVDYVVDSNIKQICTLVMLSAEKAKNPLGEQKELSASEYLETIASKLETELESQKKHLSFEESMWVQNPILEGTECSAGMIGQHVQSIVKDKLHSLGVPLSVHSSFDKSSVGIHFQVGDPWGVDIFVQDSKNNSILLSHLEIPVNYMPPSAQSCLDAQDLGLKHVQPNPALRYEIDLEKNVFCEGDVIHPIIRSSADSQIAVFSLLADGSSFLIFPSVGKDRNITSELDLGAFAAVPWKTTGEERLLVVGVSMDEKMGILSEMHSFCAITDWQKYVPKSASVKTTSYQILPAGVGGCPYDSLDPKTRFHYQRTLDRIKQCR